MLNQIQKQIKLKMIEIGLKKKCTLKLNKPIKLNNINSSTIVKKIAIDGFESYEEETFKFIKCYPYSVSTFIDGGANIGFFSICASCYHNDWDIYAIEPFPDNVDYLRALIDRNELAFNIISSALYDNTKSDVKLYFPTSKKSSLLSSSATLHNQFKGTDGLYNHLDYDSVRVKTLTLKNLMEGKVYPALIKLDCEGSELKILSASDDILKRNDVDFIIEIMMDDKDKYDVFTLMEQNGYSAYLITNAGLVRESRPLTLPYYDKSLRTCWKNHYFTKRKRASVEKFSLEVYGRWI